MPGHIFLVWHIAGPSKVFKVGVYSLESSRLLRIVVPLRRRKKKEK